MNPSTTDSRGPESWTRSRQGVLQKWAAQSKSEPTPTREAWAADLRRLGPLDLATVQVLTTGGAPRWPWIPPFERDQTTELLMRVTSEPAMEVLRKVAADAGFPELRPPATTLQPPAEASDPRQESHSDASAPESPSLSGSQRPKETTQPLGNAEARRALRTSTAIYIPRKERAVPWHRVAASWILAGLGVAIAFSWLEPKLPLGPRDQDPSQAVSEQPADTPTGEKAPPPWFRSPGLSSPSEVAPGEDDRVIQAWLIQELEKSLESLAITLRRVAHERRDPTLQALVSTRLDPLNTLSPAEQRRRPEMAEVVLVLAYLRSGGSLPGLALEMPVFRLISCGWIGDAAVLPPPTEAIPPGCEFALPAEAIHRLETWLASRGNSR